LQWHSLIFLISRLSEEAHVEHLLTAVPVQVKLDNTNFINIEGNQV